MPEATRVAAARDKRAGNQDDVRLVADNVIALMRSFSRAKARLFAAMSEDVEWSAHVLLRCLQHDGPMRAGALADLLQADPSTISRQVAGLVKDGLVERRADPGDGRASILFPTDRGRELIARYDEVRLTYFAGLVSDWTDEDLRTFGTMLDRFNQAYIAAQNEWTTERAGHRRALNSTTVGGTTE